MAVAEAQGFRAAARRLGLTPSAVSQGVRALERRVGAPLFARTTRSVGVTEAGARLLAHVRPALGLVSEGLAAARGVGGEVEGPLRLNAPRVVLPLLVDRLVPEFLARHPRVRVELVGEDRLVDLVAENFDAGLRFGHRVEADLVSLPLTPPERSVVVATPRFLKKYGRPQQVDDLRRARCVGYRRAPAPLTPWRFVVKGRSRLLRVEAAFVANDVDTCLRAVRRGAGLFQVPRSLVAKALARGELETVLDHAAVETPGLSLFYPSRSQVLPKLRAFITFAKEHLRGGDGATA